MITTGRVRVGTRGSRLALTQTGTVATDLARAAGLGPDDVELVRIRTEGDRLKGSLAALGGAGVFVAALREAVLDGRCDLAVHSLKDLPTAPAPGLLIAAIPERADPRDALCARDGLTLATLPSGARVGTGSPRRAAQIRAVRPDLDVVDIRGNVDTRLGRVPGLGEGPGDLDAVVLAAAGLSRIGRLDMASELLEPSVVPPAPGQGALAVETRADGGPVPGALAALDHLPTRLAVTAERAVLNRLEAGCAAPVGTLARVEPAAPPAPTSRAATTAVAPADTGPGPGRGELVTESATSSAQPTGETLVLDAVVCATDGSARLRASESIPVPSARAEALAAAEALGVRIAERLLADGAADLAPLGQPGALGSGPRTEPAPGTTTPSAAPGALAGWRVLVPRGGAWGDRVGCLLREHGARPTIVPLIEFVPPEDPDAVDAALAAVGRGDYAWVTVTSPRTVEFLAQSAAGLARPADHADTDTDADGTADPDRALARLLARTQVAAVGPQTADALARAGVEADLLPSDEHSARGLVADFPRPGPGTDADPAPDSAAPDSDAAAPDRPATPTGRRVLVPHSDLADATLSDGLRALGWEVDEVVAYRTVPGPTPPPEVPADLRAGGFDAVLLTSGSAVANLVDGLGTPPSSTVVCCLGPHTARDARDRGLDVTVVAQDASAAGLVEALARYAREEQR